MNYEITDNYVRLFILELGRNKEEVRH